MADQLRDAKQILDNLKKLRTEIVAENSLDRKFDLDHGLNDAIAYLERFIRANDV